MNRDFGKLILTLRANIYKQLVEKLTTSNLL